MSGSNRLAGLTARPKDTGAAEVRKVDEVGERLAGLLIVPRVRSLGGSPARERTSCTPKFSQG